jgi:hypothetical protein
MANQQNFWAAPGCIIAPLLSQIVQFKHNDRPVALQALATAGRRLPSSKPSTSTLITPTDRSAWRSTKWSGYASAGARWARLDGGPREPILRSAEKWHYRRFHVSPHRR